MLQSRVIPTQLFTWSAEDMESSNIHQKTGQKIRSAGPGIADNMVKDI